jgi:hypothetical protein
MTFPFEMTQRANVASYAFAEKRKSHNRTMSTEAR